LIFTAQQLFTHSYEIIEIIEIFGGGGAATPQSPLLGCAYLTKFLHSV